MLFNSIEFAIFLPLIFVIYWGIGSRRVREQNIALLIASYFFYGWWDWRFLGLIAFSTLVDFWVGKSLERIAAPKKRKILLYISLTSNLGLLLFFKYYNFFIDSFVEAFKFFGTHFSPNHLNIVLPVGISFYTFQTLSYTIDVYRKKIKPADDWIAFAAFVSFFPQLVAGPIERAANLLPQFQKNREFNTEKAKDGLRQILWGLFKKIVIADTCAIYANDIFGQPESYSTPGLWLGAIYFAFQIYGDFSGYSDIALGLAKLFGFELMKNFNLPYFSRDIAEFWRRWHISLSSWFKDYLYIPLGGSRGNVKKTLRNVLIIFLISGLWHGANWTFVAWGGIHALFFIPLLLLKRNRKHLDEIAKSRFLPSLSEARQILVTFLQVLIAWVFFRAANINDAIHYVAGMFDLSNMSAIENYKTKYLILILFLLAWEWSFREKEHGLHISSWPMTWRWLTYSFFIWLILYFMGEEQEFIYFQF